MCPGSHFQIVVYAQYRKNFVNNVKDPNGQPAGPLQTH
jgi:hypothetical protein